jgi:hypothetical protein
MPKSRIKKVDTHNGGWKLNIGQKGAPVRRMWRGVWISGYTAHVS